jgi:hypothetical protein
MGLLNIPGDLIGGLGHVLGLPEMGISEALGGTGRAALDSYHSAYPAGGNRLTPQQLLDQNARDAAARQNDTGAILGAATGPSQAQIAAQNAAALAAQNDSAINSALGRLDQQGGIGNQNILNSYNSAFQQLMGGQQAANQGLANARNETMTANQTARDNIGAGVRNQNIGLQRLLGAHGAGNGSAASILAPFAAAQQGNIQRSQVQDTYGKNMNALDQSQNASDIGYKNSFGQLLNDRRQKEQDLQAGLGNSRASLLGQRSDAASNQAAINAILDAVTRLGLNPTFTPQTPQVKAPDLAQYNYTPTGAPQLGNAGLSDAAAQTIGPFLSLLTGQKKQNQNPLVAA